MQMRAALSSHTWLVQKNCSYTTGNAKIKFEPIGEWSWPQKLVIRTLKILKLHRVSIRLMYSLGNLSRDIHLWWREGSECKIYYLHIWIYYLTDDNFACCKYFGKYLGHGASLHYVGLSTHSRDNWLSVIVSQSLDSYKTSMMTFKDSLVCKKPCQEVLTFECNS